MTIQQFKTKWPEDRLFGLIGHSTNMMELVHHPEYQQMPGAADYNEDYFRILENDLYELRDDIISLNHES